MGINLFIPREDDQTKQKELADASFISKFAVDKPIEIYAEEDYSSVSNNSLVTSLKFMSVPTHFVVDEAFIQSDLFGPFESDGIRFGSPYIDNLHPKPPNVYALQKPSHEQERDLFLFDYFFCLVDLSQAPWQARG